MGAEQNNLLMIPCPVVKAALLFMAKDDVRAYLNGLHVKVTGGDVAVTASDGHTLFRHEIQDYAGVEDMEVIIPHYIVKLALARARKLKAEFVPLNIDELFFGEVGFRPGGGQYPDFAKGRLFAGELPKQRTFNLNYLSRLQKACDLMGGGFLAMPRLEYYESCAALHIDDGTVAVAMAADLGDED